MSRDISRVDEIKARIAALKKRRDAADRHLHYSYGDALEFEIIDLEVELSHQIESMND